MRCISIMGLGGYAFVLSKLYGHCTSSQKTTSPIQNLVHKVDLGTSSDREVSKFFSKFGNNFDTFAELFFTEFYLRIRLQIPCVVVEEFLKM